MGLAPAPTGAAAAAMRDTWTAHGLHLPAQLPVCFLVGLDADPDAPTTLVPGCCVLTPMGLAQLPSSCGAHLTSPAALRLVARQLVEDSRGGGRLWGALAPADAAASRAPGAGGAAGEGPVAGAQLTAAAGRRWATPGWPPGHARAWAADRALLAGWLLPALQARAGWAGSTPLHSFACTLCLQAVLRQPAASSNSSSQPAGRRPCKLLPASRAAPPRRQLLPPRPLPGSA